MNFKNVTSQIDTNEFEEIKNFILNNGDKMTYRNIDSNNPHYKFENCDAFLNSDIGQKNINNDQKISDFNELTIRDWNSDIKYYHLIIIRKGSLKEHKSWVKKGMEEDQIYLVDVYDEGLQLMKNNLTDYLKQIKKEITAINTLSKK
ncbi:hypothetical protein [Flavivirga sp. 57AJ16]|uniref:hypothetical protein n=1 Tax=Flavivirga sp. 57AJ16 TaxID=3025307 RepID=UPI002365FB9E|nr:hypothetical protein [Flavivirga sp. 57AJ16]MDD7887663.1 hypothetical protein [Flavivirga sp. 57AJ16]